MFVQGLIPLILLACCIYAAYRVLKYYGLITVSDDTVPSKNPELVSKLQELATLKATLADLTEMNREFIKIDEINVLISAAEAQIEEIKKTAIAGSNDNAK